MGLEYYNAQSKTQQQHLCKTHGFGYAEVSMFLSLFPFRLKDLILLEV